MLFLLTWAIVCTGVSIEADLFFLPSTFLPPAFLCLESRGMSAELPANASEDSSLGKGNEDRGTISGATTSCDNPSGLVAPFMIFIRIVGAEGWAWPGPAE